MNGTFASHDVVHDVHELMLLLLSAVSLCAIIVHHVLARRGLRLSRSALRPALTPPITVLKPLCGVDEGLYENLLSIVRQRYSAFEVVFGVVDARDPALPVVHRLMREHPEVPMRLLVRPASANAANPKIANLLNMLQAASHEHILISDSNVRVSPEYLNELASHVAEPGVGLVSNLIVGGGDESLGARLENLHFNTFIAGSVCMGDFVGRACVIGKSMLMRRSELDALGGLASMRDVLAEDYVLGERYAEAGHRVVLCKHAVLAHNQHLPLRRFVSRHLRWAQLRRWAALDAFLCEPLLYASPLLVAPALYAGTGATGTAALCALLVTLRVGSDALLARAIAGRMPSLSALVLIPAKDFVLLAIWCVALWKRRVEWRGTHLAIGAGTRVTRVPHSRSFGARLAQALR
jgi:ceramide glucosyltransferase